MRVEPSGAAPATRPVADWDRADTRHVESGRSARGRAWLLPALVLLAAGGVIGAAPGVICSPSEGSAAAAAGGSTAWVLAAEHSRPRGSRGAARPWHGVASPGHRPPPPRLARLPRSGFLDDVGKGIVDAASTAVTGMGEGERDKLISSMMSGSMDFNDYLKMTLMMKSGGGAQAVVDTVSKVPGLQKALNMEQSDTDATDAKIQEYSKLLGAMTEEEREQPGLFLLGENARANVENLAKKAEVSVEYVDKFLSEFQVMKKFFVKMGNGFREGKSQEQIAKEIEKETDFLGQGSSSGASKNQPYVNPERAAKKAAKLAAQRKQGSKGSSSSRAKRTMRR